MSIFSSLSLWSSIKIFSYPYISSTKEKFASVPYVATFRENHQQTKDETNQRVTNVVNLKIPEVLAKKKNSATSISYKCSKVQAEEENKSSLNKSSKINLTSLSELYENCSDPSKELKGFVKTNSQIGSITTDLVIARKEFEKEFVGSDPDFENYISTLYEFEYEETRILDEKNSDLVPSVKPWTLEELDKVNKLYNTMEENIKKIEVKNERNRKKKKHTLKKKENDFKAPSCYCLSQGDPGLPLCRQSSSVVLDDWNEIFFDCEFSTSESDLDAQLSTLNSAKIEFTKRMIKLSEENYYKMKLAQLYLIANGS